MTFYDPFEAQLPEEFQREPELPISRWWLGVFAFGALTWAPVLYWLGREFGVWG